MTELEVFTQSLIVSRIALIVTLIVSTLTVVFGVLEMAFQRSHNKKSVRPLCAFALERSKDGLVLYLRNVGLGPLIIESLRIGAAGGPSSPAGEMPERVEFTDLVIPPLGSVELLELPRTKKGEAEDVAAAAGPDQVILIRYKDIYDKQYSKESSLHALARGPEVQMP